VVAGVDHADACTVHPVAADGVSGGVAVVVWNLDSLPFRPVGSIVGESHVLTESPTRFAADAVTGVSQVDDSSDQLVSDVVGDHNIV